MTASNRTKISVPKLTDQKEVLRFPHNEMAIDLTSLESLALPPKLYSTSLVTYKCIGLENIRSIFLASFTV